MSIIQGTAKATAGDASFFPFGIGQSLRLDGSSSYLSRSPASPDSLRWTISLWLKRSALGSDQQIFSGHHSTMNNDTVGGYIFLKFSSDDKLAFRARNFPIFNTDAVYRDTSAWYHIVLVFNSSSSLASLYVNSVLQTTTSPDTQYIDSANAWNSGATSGITNYIGRYSNEYFNGYIAEFNNIDGYKTDTTLATYSDFGETKNGVWVPKEYKPSGSSNQYGTNGFRLTFASSDFNTSGSAVTDPHGSSTNVPDGYVADASGSGNHWNVN